MLKNLLTAAYLLALTAAPVQSQTIATAKAMGEIVGEYQCYAIKAGVQNSNQMTDIVLREKDPTVGQMMLAAYDWYENGQKDLWDAYIRGITRYTTIYCQEEFDRYVRGGN
jgi:hypothetical protein